MRKSKTLIMIKPNATIDNNIGAIIKEFEEWGMKVKNLKMKKLTKKEVEGFYAEHINKPFFPDLVDFMTSGYTVMMILEGISAVKRCRMLMGDTDPVNALPDTIRGKFGITKTKNAVHGSDSTESAAREIEFFFGDKDA